MKNDGSIDRLLIIEMNNDYVYKNKLCSYSGNKLIVIMNTNVVLSNISPKLSLLNLVRFFKKEFISCFICNNTLEIITNTIEERLYQLKQTTVLASMH